MGSIGQVAVLIAAALAGGADPAPAVDPADFRGWFDEAAAGRLRIPAAVEARARRLRYVLVGGFRSERKPGYFAQNIRELEARGVPAAAIHEIYPSSHATAEENRDAIRAAFRAIADAGPEPLVVIGHSRGACDTLAFALREPEFVGARVAALFLVQGPFGGSGLADYVLGEGAPMDGRMPAPPRIAAHLIGRRERSLWARGRHAGLSDLTSEASSGFWERMLEEHADAIPVVGPRAYYVEAEIDPSRQRLLRRPIARYLGTYDGPNDGVVAAGDQALPGLGTSLGTLAVGHTDLTHRFPGAAAHRRLRAALIQAILMAVGREAAGPPADREVLPSGGPVRGRSIDETPGHHGRPPRQGQRPR
jgi:pimeloyl-ACP methyl ester carboxylesterase